MSLTFRTATRDDVPAIVALLTDDILGATRETDDLAPYLAAFDQLQNEGGNQVIIGVQNDEIVATYQLIFISGLSLRAARRAQVESIRVVARLRGQGLGQAMMDDADKRARAAGCSLMQFTTNKTRNRAQAFYERLGFTPSHVGYKRSLD